MKEKITRRNFMKGTPALTMGMAIDLRPENIQKIEVVLIRDEEVLGENSKHNAEIIQQMVDETVMTLMEKKSAGSVGACSSKLKMSLASNLMFGDICQYHRN